MPKQPKKLHKMRHLLLPVEAYDEIQAMLEENGIDYQISNPDGERIQIIVNNTEGIPYKIYTFDDEAYEQAD